LSHQCNKGSAIVRRAEEGVEGTWQAERGDDFGQRNGRRQSDGGYRSRAAIGVDGPTSRHRTRITLRRIGGRGRAGGRLIASAARHRRVTAEGHVIRALRHRDFAAEGRLKGEAGLVAHLQWYRAYEDRKIKREGKIAHHGHGHRRIASAVLGV